MSGTGLAENQFGFRKERSTTDAIKKVLEMVSDAGSGGIYDRELCVLVTLDIANAFNSASWDAIDKALLEKEVPAYLVRILRSYLRDRELIYGEDETTLQLTSGVPQGSVLGPLLWRIMYDALLRKEMPEGISLVGFADDVALVGRGWRTTQLTNSVNEGLARIQKWMEKNKLHLAHHKTEAVMLTRKRGYEKPIFTIQGHRVETKKSLKYLGVVIDEGRRFKAHIKAVGAKATITANRLCRLLPNIGGPSTEKRKLLSTVVHSQLLYAAPVWAPFLQYRPDGDVQLSTDGAAALKTAQRIMAIRTIRAYRTISYEAAILLADMTPIDLLADERRRIIERKVKDVNRTPAQKYKIKTEEEERTMNEWSRRWEATAKAAWTKQLIPCVRRWRDRIMRVPMSFHLTQLLTGHGCFQAYLHRMKRAQSPQCVYCDHHTDDAEHTILRCSRWDEERKPVLEWMQKREIQLHDITTLLCGPELQDTMDSGEERRRAIDAARSASTLFRSMVEKILTTKEAEERSRQANQV